MATKRRSSSRSRATTLDLEKSVWLVPVVFLLFLCALVFLFSDFIFSDQMLFGSDTLQSGLSFRSYYVENGSFLNPPQWQPQKFGGMPYVEAFNGDIFYPTTTWLQFMMPLKRALGWKLIIHIFLAGIFMYLAARQFKLAKVPSLFAAAGYMFASYLISMVAPGHDGKIFVVSLFPLMMFFLERGFERRSFLDFSLLGLVIGFMFLTPHLQLSYYAMWALSFYSAYKLIRLWLKNKQFVPLVKPTLLVTYAVIIGLGLSAIQIYPGVYYTKTFSPRGDTKSGWEWATSWSMHEEEALSLVVPEFCGTNTSEAQTYYWGKNAFKDNSESVGTVVLFLALLGAFFSRRKEAYFFAGLALFALVYALGATTPIFKLFYWAIPNVSSLRAPSTIMFLFSFSASLLAGMALHRVLTRDLSETRTTNTRYNYVLFGFPALLLVLALLFSTGGRGFLEFWSWLFYSGADTQLVQQGVTKLDVAAMNLGAIQSGAWLAFLWTSLAAVAIWMVRSGKSGVVLLLGVVAIQVVDSVRFNDRFIGVVDETRYQSQYGGNQLVDFFKRTDEKYRVLNLDEPNDNMLPYFGIDVTVGYHGNQLKWYDDLLGGPALTNIRRLSSRLINLTGTRYMLAPGNVSFPENYFGDRPMARLATVGSQALFRNDNAFPRVFLVDSFKVFEDTVVGDSTVTARQQITAQVINGNDDMRRVVYLENPPDLGVHPDTTASADSTWIINYENEVVEIGVSCSRNCLMILTENWFDAWHATLDDNPAEILRAYGAFRAVAVPAGDHTINFTYRSSRYALGRSVTWATSAFMLLVIGGTLVMNRRRRTSITSPEDNEE